MKAIQVEEYGNPAEVLKVVDLPDVGAPAAGEVVIEVEASPINQYDLLLIAGGYGYRPRLPAIMGTEGAGRVVVAAGVNPPTAYLLLTDVVKLPPGSWVIQDGANSGVGRATVAIAKALGLRTVSVVRRDAVVAELKALGGDVVLVDGPDLGQRVAAETGNAPIRLALDGVSDTSPMNLMSCLSEGGVLVSYGGTSRKPMVVHPGSFIFRKQTVRGFWLRYWYQSAGPDDVTAMFDRLAPLVAAGTISTPVAATYGFDQVGEAITKATQSGGKVLFTPNA